MGTEENSRTGFKMIIVLSWAVVGQDRGTQAKE